MSEQTTARVLAAIQRARTLADWQADRAREKYDPHADAGPPLRPRAPRAWAPTAGQVRRYVARRSPLWLLDVCPACAREAADWHDLAFVRCHPSHHTDAE